MLPLPLGLHLLRWLQSCSCRVNKFDYDHEHEHEHEKTAHWHHTWRLRRNRAGDCRARSEIGTTSEIRRIQDHRQTSRLLRSANRHAETTRAAAAALEEAVTLARRGELDAIVTGPVHKARMYEVGFRFPGQTEFFAERCGVKNFAMCLTGGKLTVALVTAHIPSAQSSARAQAIGDSARRPVACGFSVAAARQELRPRIAVAGLNPHAGESGKLGGEEIEIIAPAIEELKLVTCHSITRHVFSSVRFLPTPFSTARLKANSTRCFACTTIRD